MNNLFLGSVTERSGKSMVALGLAKSRPGRVGYYKPFREVMMSREGRVFDQDAHLMKNALGLGWSEEELSPFTYDVFRPVPLADIMAGCRRVAGDAEVMLIEGTRDITTGCMGAVSGMAIAKAADAPVVLVSSAQPSALDKICMLRQLMDQYPLSFRGVILNQVEDPSYARLLASRGVRVLGEVPPLKELRHYRVREVAEAVGAGVLAGEAGMDRTVERVMIGAMSPETALVHMRRVARKALVTGGDRADILTAALSTDTSCLVLTGGLTPAKAVLARAHQANVPVLLTDLDTLEASDRLDHLIARIDPDDEAKVDLIARTVREHVDLDAVWE